jgi:hypothetical protein
VINWRTAFVHLRQVRNTASISEAVRLNPAAICKPSAQQRPNTRLGTPWKSNPKVYGDDLAASLYLTAKILMQQEPSKACETVKEASQAAVSPNFKKAAEVEFPDCKSSPK